MLELLCTADKNPPARMAAPSAISPVGWYGLLPPDHSILHAASSVQREWENCVWVYCVWVCWASGVEIGDAEGEGDGEEGGGIKEDRPQRQ